MTNALTLQPLREGVNVLDVIGMLPFMLYAGNPRSVREQFDDNYMGGWRPFKGHTLDKDTMTLAYPGDPPLEPLVKMTFRDEHIYVYRHGWVLVLQPNGEWEVARMD